MPRRGLAVAALFALVGLFFYWLSMRAAESEPRRVDDDSPSRDAVGHAAGSSARASQRKTTSTKPEEPAQTGPAASSEPDPRFAHRFDRVTHALELLRYPPSSQPLRADMKDVLQPNRRWEAPLPLALATGGTKEPPKAGDLSFLLTGDVFIVVDQGSLLATLEVFREVQGKRERVAVDVTGGDLTALAPSGAKQVASGLLLADDGRNGDAEPGDHVYSATITPTAIPGLSGYRGAAKLDVAFVAADGDRRAAQASLDFRVTGASPATFTGVSGEKLTAEGLEIDVDLQIREGGAYFVQGCLFDAHDQPIGFAVSRPPLTPGRATVPLVFFGLLFHDAQADGPYVFRTLTGNRLPAAGEPDHAEMEAWGGRYVTKRYAVGDFSDKEHESPQKDAKIQALSDLAGKPPSRGAPASSGK